MPSCFDFHAPIRKAQNSCETFIPVDNNLPKSSTEIIGLWEFFCAGTRRLRYTALQDGFPPQRVQEAILLIIIYVDLALPTEHGGEWCRGGTSRDHWHKAHELSTTFEIHFFRNANCANRCCQG